ncbi:MAG TPA: PIG-L deacetylase family protein [Ktedonobacteraceae bacterium]|nr:PIG-L deacetylase family protein [Ktedonobacteraceae bacterium]
MAPSSSVLLPPGGQRILVIQAHPDDAEFLCGGTIARLASEGCEIHYLLVTKGDKGTNDPDMTPARLSSIRAQEQERAAKALGVQTVTFLAGYTDGEVEATLGLRRDLILIVRQWRPDVVFTFDPWKHYDFHPDHRAVGMCTQDALVNAGGRWIFPEQLVNGVTAHSVKHIYYFSTDQPNYWVDISNVIDKKIAAMRCHESQMVNFDPDDYARRKGRQAGTEHKYKFAEAFHHDVI